MIRSTLHHWWDAPTIPGSTPDPATVVVTSRCGQRLNLPAYAARRMETGSVDPTATDADTCKVCVNASGPFHLALAEPVR